MKNERKRANIPFLFPSFCWHSNPFGYTFMSWYRCCTWHEEKRFDGGQANNPIYLHAQWKWKKRERKIRRCQTRKRKSKKETIETLSKNTDRCKVATRLRGERHVKRMLFKALQLIFRNISPNKERKNEQELTHTHKKTHWMLSGDLLMLPSCYTCFMGETLKSNDLPHFVFMVFWADVLCVCILKMKRPI